MIELGIASGPPVERHGYTSMYTAAAEAYAEHGLYGAMVGAVEIAAAMNVPVGSSSPPQAATTTIRTKIAEMNPINCLGRRDIGCLPLSAFGEISHGVTDCQAK